MYDINTICRTIMDTNDVIKQQVGELLLAELTVSSSLTKQEVTTLHQKLQNILDEQTNSLVDRVIATT